LALNRVLSLYRFLPRSHIVPLLGFGWPENFLLIAGL
jgi:hypothetical protein